jgi:tetratricopeptide (TPR) repeat protein
MARRVTKSTKVKKPASPAKKAAKARAPKKAAKAKKGASKSTAKQPKRSAAKKAAPKKAAGKKVVPKKKALPKPAKPRAKASKAVKPAKKGAKPAIKKSAKAARPAVKKAKHTKARPAVKRAPKPPPRRPAAKPKPRAKSKPTPAELEALRIAKELRQAQERQLGHYDKAIRAFNSRRFQTALTLFEKVAAGPDSTFGDRARVHIQVCRRQTQTRKVKLKTADELYNYGIQLINERRFQEASRCIAQALKRQPRGAHIHFAAAVVGALTQDTESTYKSLKKAIELDPHNRVLALNDTDLASVADEPAIAKLLHGDR